MSIASTTISSSNPVTATDVHAAAAQLGVVVREDEMETLTFLLAAAHDTFEEIMALPDFVLPTELDKFPRRYVRPGNLDSELGAVWSYWATISRTDSQQEEHPGGLLAGKNLVVKDNICVAGIPQSQGSDAIASWIPDADATVVTRSLHAGATIVGTATCEALSCATVSNTASAGPIYNPFAKGYSAGGSSSGVASLVARLKPVVDDIDGQLEVHMGIGADQGGSIRVPAAFCGLVGLKATHGLIPYTGVANCEAVLDHVGPICRTVWDTALLLEAIAGTDSIDDRQIGATRHKELLFSSDLLTWYSEAVAQHGSQPLQGKKVAIVQEAMDAAYMKSEMKDEVYGVSEQLRKLGVEIEVVSIPWHSTGASLWMGMCRHSLLSGALGNPIGRRCYYPLGLLRNMLPWDQEKWDRLPSAMRNEFINGVYEQTYYPVLYAKCMNLSLKLRQEYDAILERFDALLLPTVPFTAPPLFDRNTASSYEKISATFGQTLNTMQFNLTGHPAMSIPTGLRTDMSGQDASLLLPVGVQLVGRHFSEATLLQLGYAYENSFNWRERVNGVERMGDEMTDG